MAHYSEVFKQEMVQKVLQKGHQTFESFAQEHQISESALRRWIHQSSEVQQASSSSRESQWNHLVATEHLDEQELGAYCRSQGLYAFQLKQWREELMTRPDPSEGRKAMRLEMNQLKTEIKQLKRDLVRKDKALAEVSALLILKKKADLLWGVSEDDPSELNRERKR